MCRGEEGTDWRDMDGMRDDYISGTDSGARMFGIKDQSGLSKPHFANLRSGPAFRRRPGRARQSRSFLFGNSGRHRLIQHDTPSPSSIHLLACAQSHPPTHALSAHRHSHRSLFVPLHADPTQQAHAITTPCRSQRAVRPCSVFTIPVPFLFVFVFVLPPSIPGTPHSSRSVPFFRPKMTEP